MIPTLPKVTAEPIRSSRLSTRVLFTGFDDAIPVLFLHGNLSSATFWEETMVALPPAYWGIAPDQRGYGDADRRKKIDATRGMADLASDAVALLDALDVERAHVVGHSMGGSVIWRLLTDCPSRLLTATLVCPASPYGFGGTQDVEGMPCYPDFAGSGAGTVSQTFIDLLAAEDRSETFPESPRVVMNSLYWKPPFRPAHEEALLSSMLSTHVGKRDYPGDFTRSGNGPVPGKWGPVNAMSPKYANDMERLYKTSRKPPVLWVRGRHDHRIERIGAGPSAGPRRGVATHGEADPGGVEEVRCSRRWCDEKGDPRYGTHAIHRKARSI